MRPPTYIACAYCTPDYLELAKHMRSSLEKFSIPLFLKEIADQGTWEKNTLIKPSIILECLNQHHDKDVLYIDTDAVMVKRPDLLDHITTDIALYVNAHKGKRGLLSFRANSGTVFIRNTAMSRKFLQIWIDKQASANRFTVDQDTLSQAIAACSGLTITTLPKSYYKIFDQQSDDTVIEHFQASRKKTRARKSVKKTERFFYYIAAGVGLTAAFSALAATL